VKGALEQISYGLHIHDGLLCVDFEAEKTDCVKDIRQDFDEKARWGVEAEVGRQEILLFRQAELSPLEVLVMKALAEKYPKEFRDVHEAAQASQIIPEPFIGRFVKEVRFYFLYLDLMTKIRGKGCPFVYPDISEEGGIEIRGAYDLALAISTQTVVPNDFVLSDEERSVIITGANQGGKTTFLRSVGLAQAMAQSGLFTAAQSLSCPVYSGVYTHFPNGEDKEMNSGLLEVELRKLDALIGVIRPGALLLMNESFATTTPGEAAFLSGQVTRALRESDITTFFVTHLFGFADALWQLQPSDVRFLRAPRDTDGGRSYRLEEGAPGETGYAQDLYTQTIRENL
jgi:hypothetical protein